MSGGDAYGWSLWPTLSRPLLALGLLLAACSGSTSANAQGWLQCPGQWINTPAGWMCQCANGGFASYIGGRVVCQQTRNQDDAAAEQTRRQEQEQLERAERHGAERLQSPPRCGEITDPGPCGQQAACIWVKYLKSAHGSCRVWASGRTPTSFVPCRDYDNSSECIASRVCAWFGTEGHERQFEAVCIPRALSDQFMENWADAQRAQACFVRRPNESAIAWAETSTASCISALELPLRNDLKAAMREQMEFYRQLKSKFEIEQREKLVLAESQKEREPAQQAAEQRRAEQQAAVKAAELAQKTRGEEERRLAELREFVNDLSGCGRYVLASCERAERSSHSSESDRRNIVAWRKTAQAFERDHAACEKGSATACYAALDSPVGDEPTKELLRQWRARISTGYRVIGIYESIVRRVAGTEWTPLMILYGVLSVAGLVLAWTIVQAYRRTSMRASMLSLVLVLLGMTWLLKDVSTGSGPITTGSKQLPQKHSEDTRAPATGAGTAAPGAERAQPPGAQHAVEWKFVRPIQPLRGLEPGKTIEVMGYGIGQSFDQVFARLRKEYGTLGVYERDSEVFAMNAYIHIPNRGVRIGEGIPSPLYKGSIALRFQNANLEEDVHFGFSSPATGRMLMGVTRSTTLKNAADFLSEDRAYAPWIEKFGQPTQRQKFYVDHSSASWFIGRAGSAQVPSECRGSEYIGCGHVCGGDAGKLARGEYIEVVEAQTRRDIWQSQCRGYGFFVTVTLHGNPGRFSRISVQVADFLAAEEAFGVDTELIREIRKRFAPGTGNAYKP